MVTRRSATACGGHHACAVAACIFVLTALPLLAQRGAGARDQAKLPPGDAANGKALVESNKCLDCHRIGETGSRRGPDLSDVGNRRSPDALHRATVAPDEEVLPEHRFVRVVTKDGTSVVGRLLNQDAFSIQLMNKDEQLKSYLKSNLREHTILTKRMMPSYEGTLTMQQAAD